MSLLQRLPRPSRPQARDAARVALQSAIAAAATYTVMRILGWSETYIGVLGAVLIVQPSVGGTLGQAGQRIAATLVGSVVGVLCLIALPAGYGTAVALALSVFVVIGIAGFKPEWQYGAVAAIAIALGSESDAMAIAQDRAKAIALGAGIGVLCSLLVWPETAARRLGRHATSVMQAIRDNLKDALAKTADPDPGEKLARQTDYYTAMAKAREAARVDHSRGRRRPEAERLDILRRLYNSVVLLTRAARGPGDLRGQDDFGRDLDRFSEAAAGTLDTLIRDKTLDPDALEETWRCVEALRAAAPSRPGQDSQQLHRTALVFAAGEIAEDLRALGETYGRGEERRKAA